LTICHRREHYSLNLRKHAHPRACKLAGRQVTLEAISPLNYG
jgi:hypothetical protein